MLTSLHLHKKILEGLYQSKVTSSLACIHGQVTKHTTVKWPIVPSYHCMHCSRSDHYFMEERNSINTQERNQGEKTRSYTRGKQEYNNNK